MKNIFKFLIFSAFLISCENFSNNSQNKKITESVDLLKQKKEEKLIQIEKLKNDIEIINSELDSSLNNENAPIVSKFDVKSSIFEHYLEFSSLSRKSRDFKKYLC